MKIYYLACDNSQEGPFSLEELQAKTLTSNHYIWSESIGKWTNITEVEEVISNVKLVSVPPKFINPTIRARNRKYLFITLLTLIPVTFLHILYQEAASCSKDFYVKYNNIWDWSYRQRESEDFYDYKVIISPNPKFSRAQVMVMILKDKLGIDIITHSLVIYKGYTPCNKIDIHFGDDKQFTHWDFKFYNVKEDIFCDYTFSGVKKTLKVECK